MAEHSMAKSPSISHKQTPWIIAIILSLTFPLSLSPSLWVNYVQRALLMKMYSYICFILCFRLLQLINFLISFFASAKSFCSSICNFIALFTGHFRCESVGAIFPKIRAMKWWNEMRNVSLCSVSFCVRVCFSFSFVCCYKLSYMLFMYCTHQCWHWSTSGAHEVSNWQRYGRAANVMNAGKMVVGEF